MNDEAAIARIADIVLGTHEKRTVSKQRNGDGDVISETEVIAQPSAREVLQAVDLRAKLTGLYKQQQIDADIARDEYKQMKKQWLKELGG